jgi:hypothetical protein
MKREDENLSEKEVYIELFMFLSAKMNRSRYLHIQVSSAARFDIISTKGKRLA